MSRVIKILRSIPAEDIIIAVFAALAIWLTAAVVAAIAP